MGYKKKTPDNNTKSIVKTWFCLQVKRYKGNKIKKKFLISILLFKQTGDNPLKTKIVPICGFCAHALHVKKNSYKQHFYGDVL